MGLVYNSLSNACLKALSEKEVAVKEALIVLLSRLFCLLLMKNRAFSSQLKKLIRD